MDHAVNLHQVPVEVSISGNPEVPHHAIWQNALASVANREEECQFMLSNADYTPVEPQQVVTGTEWFKALGLQPESWQTGISLSVDLTPFPSVYAGQSLEEVFKNINMPQQDNDDGHVEQVEDAMAGPQSPFDSIPVPVDIDDLGQLHQLAGEEGNEDGGPLVSPAAGLKLLASTLDHEELNDEELADLAHHDDVIRVHATYHKENTTVYALWLNAPEMMAQPDVPGIFLKCNSERYDIEQPPSKVSGGQLLRGIGIPKPGNFRNTVKLGQPFTTPNGQLIPEGTFLAKFLEACQSSAHGPKSSLAPTKTERGARRSADARHKAEHNHEVHEVDAAGAGAAAGPSTAARQNGDDIQQDQATDKDANKEVTGRALRRKSAPADLSRKQHAANAGMISGSEEDNDEEAGRGKKRSRRRKTSAHEDGDRKRSRQDVDDSEADKGQAGTVGSPRMTRGSVRASAGQAGGGAGADIKEEQDHAVDLANRTASGQPAIVTAASTDGSVRVKVDSPTQESVFALWVNVKDYLHGQPEPLFLVCDDDKYKVAGKDQEPVSSQVLLDKAGLPPDANMREVVVLAQEFRAPPPGGRPKFAVGTSIGQLMDALNSIGSKAGWHEINKKQAAADGRTGPRHSKSADGIMETESEPEQDYFPPDRTKQSRRSTQPPSSRRDSKVQKVEQDTVKHERGGATASAGKRSKTPAHSAPAHGGVHVNTDPNAPPVLPNLRTDDTGGFALGCELEVMGALGRLLRWLGCQPQVNRQLWQYHKQHFSNTGDPSASRQFGLRYGELQDAMAAEDKEWVLDILRKEFELPV